MDWVYYIECGVEVFEAWKGDRGEALGGSCLGAFPQQRLERQFIDWLATARTKRPLQQEQFGWLLSPNPTRQLPQESP